MPTETSLSPHAQTPHGAGRTAPHGCTVLDCCIALQKENVRTVLGSVGGEYSEAYMPLRIRESKLLSKAGLVYAVAARPAGNGPR